jgi:hypothetical protein
MTSILKISEQCKYLLGAGDIQPLIASVIDCYSSAVKKEWYENKQDGVSEIDGVFIYNFGKDGSLSPILDLTIDTYYIVIPSSYLRLPAEMGVNQVSFIKGQSKPFIRVGSASVGMWSGLLAGVMGGHQTYYVEGTRMYFPKMTNMTNGNLMLKLSVALDEVDVDEELNIPRSVVDNIVNMVVQKFGPRKPEEEKIKV